MNRHHQTAFTYIFTFAVFAFIGMPLSSLVYGIENRPEMVQEVEKAQIDDKPRLIKVNQSQGRSSEFWMTLYSIESNSGKDLFTPALDRKGVTDCDHTPSPCGFHQVSEMAINDLSMCEGRLKACKALRMNYDYSLKMAKAYVEVITNDYGCNFNDWMTYSSYNQGCYGFKLVIKASKGEKLTNKQRKLVYKHMSRNSMYSYSDLKKLGTRKASKSFLYEWESKWNKHKQQYLASI